MSGSERLILGVDPGATYTGLALVEADGERWAVRELRTLYTPKTRARCSRYLEAAEEVGKILDLHRPDLVLVEEYAAYGMSPSVINAFDLGLITQAVLGEAHRRVVDWLTLPAAEARRWLTGSHIARPATIRVGLQRLGFTGRSNEHERDALMLVLYWLLGRDQAPAA